MNESIPIPSTAVQIARQMQASAAIQRLKLENIILKHIVDMLDPEYDYIMDLEKMSVEKVAKNVDESSLGEETEGREEGAPGGETRGLNIGDRGALVGQSEKPANPFKKVLHPPRNQ